MQVGNSIYMDYQATTPTDPRVSEVMTVFQQDVFANPHSSHILGQQAADAVAQARTDIEQLIGASAEEVIFTSGATESNNQAIASALFARKSNRNTILISEIEHKCVKNAAYFFADKTGATVKEIPVLSSGLIDLEAYKSLLSDKVCLVSIMAVNNEIGTIQNIAELASLAHEHGILFHCDAAQAPEAIDIDVKHWNVDMLSLSGHKVYGPKGIGLLYIKEHLQAQLPPFIQGGGQQFGMRSGTLPTGLCVGMAKALTLSHEEAGKSRQTLVSLREQFIQQLQSLGITFQINGSMTQRHPGNLNILFPGVNANALLEALQPDICASTGSACNSEMIVTSHVLKAIGLSDEQAGASIRFSLGRFSDSKQIEKAIQTLVTQIRTHKQ